MRWSEDVISAFVVSAPRSGAGKTSVAIGIMRWMRDLGSVVQPYKVGPDYLDPMYHRLAAGRPPRSLDTFLMTRELVAQTFWLGAVGADVAVVEGVMGLYDGKLDSFGVGSTAEVARVLGLPILLVLDVSGQGQTAAAVVLGMAAYDPQLTIMGVVLNKVGSARHEQSLRREIETKTGIPVIGAIPRDGLPRLPQRHLGLVPVDEIQEVQQLLSCLAERIGKYVDVRAILEGSRRPRRYVAETTSDERPARSTVAVARDDAFNFYYEDNLDLLKKAGVCLVEFSPLRDTILPAQAQGLYLGGGYPEVFAQRLAQNKSMLKCIKEAVADGMPVYAECGGLMYLAQGIRDAQGTTYAMCGVLDTWAALESSRVALGYVTVEIATPCWLGDVGCRLRGHEYHWSRLDRTLYPPLYRVVEPRPAFEGIVGGPRGNVLASYVHLHFGSSPGLAEKFAEASCEFGRG